MVLTIKLDGIVSLNDLLKVANHRELSLPSNLTIPLDEASTKVGDIPITKPLE